MLLIEDLDTMILERQLDPGTEANYRRNINAFGAYLGRPAERSDLSERTVNEWLRSLEAKYKPPTVLGNKRGITVLWNWLVSTGQVQPYHASRLRKIRLNRKPPVAWSIPNVVYLLQAAEQLEGSTLSGLRLRDLMYAWVTVAYETGLRPKDLLRLEYGSVVGNRVFLVQHKTKQPHTCTLTDATIEAIEAIRRDGEPRIFGMSKNTMRHYEVKLFEIAASLGFQRSPGQSTGTLRKTHGTEIARNHGIEAAARALGHVSGTKIARDHYVQPDALAAPPPPPVLNYAHSPSRADQDTQPIAS